MSRSREVDDYLHRLPSLARERISELREIVHSVAPGAEEVIRRGLLAFRHREKPLVSIGAARRHAALYVMYGDEPAGAGCFPVAPMATWSSHDLLRRERRRRRSAPP